MSGSRKEYRAEGLYPREKECLRLVPELRTSKAIGDRLRIKPDTVDGYLKSAMRKLGAPDRFAAARALHIVEQPGADPPLFGVPQTTGMADEQPVIAPSAQHDGKPAVSSELREMPINYEAGRPGQSPWPSHILGPLHRSEGGQNRLGSWRRLGIMLTILVLTVLTFFVLTGALLAFAAAYKELERL